MAVGACCPAFAHYIPERNRVFQLSLNCSSRVWWAVINTSPTGPSGGNLLLPACSMQCLPQVSAHSSGGHRQSCQHNEWDAGGYQTQVSLLEPEPGSRPFLCVCTRHGHWSGQELWPQPLEEQYRTGKHCGQLRANVCAPQRHLTAPSSWEGDHRLGCCWAGWSNLWP